MPFSRERFCSRPCVAMFVAGCASSPPTPAGGCVRGVRAAYPDWYDYARDSAEEVGHAGVRAQMAFVRHESSYRAEGEAAVPSGSCSFRSGRASSAKGYAQAQDPVWGEYQEERGPTVPKPLGHGGRARLHRLVQLQDLEASSASTAPMRTGCTSPTTRDGADIGAAPGRSKPKVQRYREAGERDRAAPTSRSSRVAKRSFRCDCLVPGLAVLRLRPVEVGPVSGAQPASFAGGWTLVAVGVDGVAQSLREAPPFSPVAARAPRDEFRLRGCRRAPRVRRLALLPITTARECDADGGDRSDDAQQLERLHGVRLDPNSRSGFHHGGRVPQSAPGRVYCRLIARRFSSFRLVPDAGTAEPFDGAAAMVGMGIPPGGVRLPARPRTGHWGRPRPRR